MRNVALLICALTLTLGGISIACKGNPQPKADATAGTRYRTEYRTENYTETIEEIIVASPELKQISPRIEWNSPTLQLITQRATSFLPGIPSDTANNVWYFGYDLAPLSDNSSITLELTDYPLIQNNYCLWADMIINVYDTKIAGDLKAYEGDVPEYTIIYSKSGNVFGYQDDENSDKAEPTDAAKRYTRLHPETTGGLGTSLIADVKSSLDKDSTAKYEEWEDNTNTKLQTYTLLKQIKASDDYNWSAFKNGLVVNTSGTSHLGIIIASAPVSWIPIKSTTYTWVEKTKTKKQIIKQRSVPYQVPY